jgi:hypothetical protein
LKESESVGIFPELNSQPIAEVLSPMARIHSDSVDVSRHSIHTFTAMPMNSNKLLKRLSPKRGLVEGMRIRQANP